jgi:hypothetical protein
MEGTVKHCAVPKDGDPGYCSKCDAKYFLRSTLNNGKFDVCSECPMEYTSFYKIPYYATDGSGRISPHFLPYPQALKEIFQIEFASLIFYLINLQPSARPAMTLL